MTDERIQTIADEITGHVLTVIFGDRYTNLDNLEDDYELNWLWENINEKVFEVVRKGVNE